MDKSLRSNLTPIIVIDEAHLLKTDAITDLRLLSALRLILPPSQNHPPGQEHLKYILKETSMPTSHNASGTLPHSSPY
ncbi:MAG: hypothetical protein HS127_15875 [Planctomycetia bacterium]|nr:hypothetical protein [Planctomycetia bacterium]